MARPCMHCLHARSCLVHPIPLSQRPPVPLSDAGQINREDRDNVACVAIGGTGRLCVSVGGDLGI